MKSVVKVVAQSSIVIFVRTVKIGFVMSVMSGTNVKERSHEMRTE